MNFILCAKVVFCGNLQNIFAEFLWAKNENFILLAECLFQQVLFCLKLVAYVKNNVEFCG